MPKLPPISFAFYQRMNPRERVLALIVGGTVFILLNLFAISYLVGAFQDLSEQSATSAQALKREKYWADSQPMWEKRTSWLHAKQPVLTNRDRAPTQLLEQVQGAARANQVLIKNQQPRALGASTRGVAAGTGPTEYQAVSVHFEVECDWKQLVNFLAFLQKPENFIVFDLASVHTDPSDAKLMKCSFDVSKWDAPAAK